MTTEVQTLEEVAPDMAIEIGRVAWQLQDLALQWQRGGYPEEVVDQIDVLYCQIESAMDRIRQALVARQTGRA